MYVMVALLLFIACVAVSPSKAFSGELVPALNVPVVQSWLVLNCVAAIVTVPSPLSVTLEPAKGCWP